MDKTKFIFSNGKASSMTENLTITGIPQNVDPGEASVLRSRLLKASNDFIAKTKISDNQNDDIPIELRAEKYKARQPFYSFNQLVVPDSVKNSLLDGLNLIRLEDKIFNEWGLKEIEPNPRSVLNFYGPPGTGKTLAAHALASHCNKRILASNYAEIESKFVGDGPKNIDAIFHAAERDNALLFIDEADSLLSKRLTNVSQGSEQAINSMRSQLLINLELFSGLIVFATNLLENYDQAFETRVRHIHFLLPDEACRREIWHRHLPKKLPIDEKISLERLAADYSDICGRDIKNAVIAAAVRTASEGRIFVAESDLRKSLEDIISSRTKDNSEPLSPKEQKIMEEKIRAKLSQSEESGIENT
jgi:SpoVK/Ycf46/Vps4 family AAA+-type ATPase